MKNKNKTIQKQNKPDGLPAFLIRLVVSISFVILVMYLYKNWFTDKSSPGSHVFAATVRHSKPANPLKVDWWKASQYTGKYASVEGKIVLTHNTGNVCFLNFNENYKKHFTAVIFASDFNKFPQAPETYFLNKNVRLTGYIKDYNGKPEMILNDPSQITVTSSY